MKRKLSLLILICALVSVVATLSACSAPAGGSIKSITKPYIATYECVEARLGNENMLDKYEFINLTLLDGKEFEVSAKPKGGEKRTVKGGYVIDPETRELEAELGIFGCEFREKIKIEHGEFVITHNFATVPLYMKFKMK